jgi:copper chaperone CopZ
MTKRLMLSLLIVVFSISGFAAEKSYPLIYQGKVQGMVCAFCVYNVSKKIALLPEINPESVNVNLKSKVVNFRSSSKISFKKLASVFSDSGFKLVELSEVKKATLQISDYETKPVLNFRLDSTNIEEYESIFESIGIIAASTLGKLVIKAPESVEIAVLKPMIGGKQKIARVQYEPGPKIEIKLYLRTK